MSRRALIPTVFNLVKPGVGKLFDWRALNFDRSRRMECFDYPPHMRQKYRTVHKEHTFNFSLN